MYRVLQILTPQEVAAARPVKSRPASSATVHARPASYGETCSSMSWP